MSSLVLEEVRRNLELKRPEVLPVWELLVAALSPQIVDPDVDSVRVAENYVELKDAALVAAAIAVDFFVSLDKRHLTGVPEVARRSGLRIVPPGDVVKALWRGRT